MVDMMSQPTPTLGLLHPKSFYPHWQIMVEFDTTNKNKAGVGQMHKCNEADQRGTRTTCWISHQFQFMTHVWTDVRKKISGK